MPSSSTASKVGLADIALARDQPRYKRIMAYVIITLGISIILLHVYTAAFGQVHYVIQRHFTMSVAMVIAVLWRPLGRSWSQRLNWWFAADLAVILMAIVPFIYVLTDLQRWVSAGVYKLSPFEIVLATMFTVALLETTRRIISWIISVIVLFFIVQNFLGPYFPSPFYGPATHWPAQALNIWSEIGAFGMQADIVSSYLIMFFFFASLLKCSGAGTVLLNLSISLVGRFAGGPAKVAVLGSSFFGTMSGSSVANVVGTGTFTIPMMKKLGFRPEQAGAVEATSSSGGQFVPPVMGTTAFLISQFLGVPYVRIMAAALIPAFLFYLAVFLQVHFMAKKSGLSGMPVSQLPRFKEAIKPTWRIFVPIAVLVFMLMEGYALGRVALYASAVMLVCGFIGKTDPRLTPRSLFDSFCETITMLTPVAVVIGAIGIIVASFYASGVGDKMAQLIVSTSGGSYWPPLLLTAVVCVVLGMGVSTTVIYILMLFITIPALIASGVDPLAAHFFTFFLGVTAGITPPVCIVAFTAGTIAGAPLMKTGLYACRLSAVAWIVPFLFVANPELLMEGSPVGIISRLFFATAGVVAMAIGFEQYLSRKLRWQETILFLVTSIACWWPYSLTTNIVGVIALMALMAHNANLFSRLFGKERTEELKIGDGR